MSETNNSSLDKEQEQTTLKIENEINENLTGELQENALKFVEFLKTNGIMTNYAVSPIVFRYYDEAVCVVVLHPIYDDKLGWNVYLGDYDSTICRSEYEDFPIDEELKEFAWEHKHTCGNCGCGNQPGKRFKILGKDFDNVCTSLMWFGNADDKTLEKLMELVKVWKLCIDDKRSN